MTAIAPGQTIHGFTVESEQSIPEHNGTAYRMRHGATGIELLHIDVQDEEKGFAIAFKTLPADNTGVFHILEHSVLCGSEKFPVKSPFAHLRKTSMNTYLNAGTAPNYTVFPVASTNEQDLMNLMDVYLDAVFHPAILREPRILQQEGWHREYDGEQLRVNGVVYNEMKGKLASPDVALMHAIDEELFPDTPYRFVAGGIPGEIETLTYDAFIDAYKRHYRPENAAIVLYGPLDIERVLELIDAEHLARVDAAEAPGQPNRGNAQAPTVSTGRKVYHEAPPENASVAFASVFAENADTQTLRAMSVVLNALLGNNEAPLKRRLLDTGLADDFYPIIGSGDGYYAGIGAEHIKPHSAQAFQDAVRNACREILDEGLPTELLQASLFAVDFQARTGGASGHPSAATYLSACIGMWASGQPLSARALRYESELAFLRDALDTDYFERLVRKTFLDTDHYAVVELIPQARDEASAVPDDAPDAAADAAPQPPDAETIARVEEAMADLKRYHDTPDSPEAVQRLPRLKREDCATPPVRPENHLVDVAGWPVLRLGYADAGIAHIIRYYDISSLSFDDYRYLFVLASLLSETDTARHTAKELFTLQTGRLGSLHANISVGPHHQDGALRAYLWVYTCSLESDIAFTSEFVDEVLHETLFDNREKLRETVTQAYLYTKMLVTEARPHRVAVTRARAHLSPAAVLDDAIQGIGGYHFLKDLAERVKDDAEADKLLERLKRLCARVFGTRPALLSYSGSDAALERFIAAEQACTPAYEKRAARILAEPAEQPAQPAGSPAPASSPRITEVEPLSNGDEAFVIPGNTAYYGRTREIARQPHYIAGRWRVASTIASLDFLWNEVRVKGGAYGVGFAVNVDGCATGYAYRDPQIDATTRSFEDVAGWLGDVDLTEEEFDGYVIGSIGKFDQPVKALERVLMESKIHAYGKHGEFERRRHDVVACTLEDVRRTGRELKACAGAPSTVVLASRAIIDASNHDFDVQELV
ncbi:MAG: insulinase family protein [Coriobacteriaceae bacterium]|nr:insulinase family protein [Coriobacteriaceae bacterium]